MKKFVFVIIVLSAFIANTALSQTFSVTISGPTDSICSGAAILFNARTSNAQSVSSYQWEINGLDVGSNDSSFQATALQNNDVVTCIATVSVAGGPDLKATSNSIRILVKTSPSPAIQISITANPFCEGTSVTLTATTQNAGTNPSYMWKTQTQRVGNNDSTYTTSNFVDGDKINCLLLTNNPKCASFYVVSNLITLQVLPVPVITISGQPFFSNPASTQLTATIVGNPASFIWSPSASLNNSAILNPVATPFFTTKYTLKVVDQDGCKAQKEYLVKEDRKISVPNAFTPNGDGVNDVFRVFYGADFTQVSLRVYNRWGQLVFVDYGSNKSWDGTIGGQTQPTGSYVWYFSYRDENGILNTMRGTVLLIR